MDDSELSINDSSSVLSVSVIFSAQPLFHYSLKAVEYNAKS